MVHVFVCADSLRLGSWFRDAAWYFVGCKFPETLSANGTPHVSPPKDRQFKWPTYRIFFAGCQGPDYPWLKDNLEHSPAKTAAAITAAWIFRGVWDPESTAAPRSHPSARTGNIVVAFAEPVTVKDSPALVLADGTAATYRGVTATSLPRCCMALRAFILPRMKTLKRIA